MEQFLICTIFAIFVTSIYGQNILKSEAGGLQCISGSGQEKICQGKTTEYTKSEAEIQKSMGGTVGLRSGAGGIAGYRPPTQARCGSSNGGCQVLNIDFTPTVLYNRNGNLRYILQVSPFEQKIFLGVCGNDRCGGGRPGKCEQKYQRQQLICWDPNNVSGGLLVENFNLPTCCGCSGWGSVRGGSGGDIKFDGPVA